MSLSGTGEVPLYFKEYREQMFAYLMKCVNKSETESLDLLPWLDTQIKEIAQRILEETQTVIRANRTMYLTITSCKIKDINTAHEGQSLLKIIFETKYPFLLQFSKFKDQTTDVLNPNPHAQNIIKRDLTVSWKKDSISTIMTWSPINCVYSDQTFSLSRKPSISDTYKLLWKATENREDTDIEFVIGDQRIHAHRLILKLTSGRFKVFFNSGSSEVQNGVVVIQNRSAEIFKLYLEFLYCGDVVPHDRVKFKDLLEMNLLADFYQENRLEDWCAERILALVSDRNTMKEEFDSVLDLSLANVDLIETLNRCIDFAEYEPTARESFMQRVNLDNLKQLMMIAQTRRCILVQNRLTTYMLEKRVPLDFNIDRNE